MKQKNSENLQSPYSPATAIRCLSLLNITLLLLKTTSSLKDADLPFNPGILIPGKQIIRTFLLRQGVSLCQQYRHPLIACISYPSFGDRTYPNISNHPGITSTSSPESEDKSVRTSINHLLPGLTIPGYKDYYLLVQSYQIAMPMAIISNWAPNT
jgi:hypothetical protein